MKLRSFKPDDMSLEAIAVGNRKAHLAHDAAYAHALVQAMDWLESEYHIIHEFKVGTTMLRAKADEIMRGFGYTNE